MADSQNPFYLSDELEREMRFGAADREAYAEEEAAFAAIDVTPAMIEAAHEISRHRGFQRRWED